VLPSGFEAAALGGGVFDGRISQDELDGVLLNWGRGAAVDTAAIPEPTAAVAGLIAAWPFMTRRRRPAAV